jgi:hypothetical protein
MNNLNDKYYLKYLKYKKKYIDLQNSKNVQTGGLFDFLKSNATKEAEKEAEKEARIKADKARIKADEAKLLEIEKSVVLNTRLLDSEKQTEVIKQSEKLLSELNKLVSLLEIFVTELERTTDVDEKSILEFFSKFIDNFDQTMKKIGEIDEFVFLSMIEKLERALESYSIIETLKVFNPQTINQIKNKIKILHDKTARVRKIFLTGNEIKVSIKNLLIKLEQFLNKRLATGTATSGNTNRQLDYVKEDLKRIDESIGNSR